MKPRRCTLGSEAWGKARSKAAEKIVVWLRSYWMCMRNEAPKSTAFRYDREEFNTTATFCLKKPMINSWRLMPYFRHDATESHGSFGVVMWALVKRKWRCVPPFSGDEP